MAIIVWLIVSIVSYNWIHTVNYNICGFRGGELLRHIFWYFLHTFCCCFAYMLCSPCRGPRGSGHQRTKGLKNSLVSLQYMLEKFNFQLRSKQVAVSTMPLPLCMDAVRLWQSILSDPWLLCRLCSDSLHRTLLQLGQSAGISVQLSLRAVMWKHQPETGFSWTFIFHAFPSNSFHRAT